MSEWGWLQGICQHLITGWEPQRVSFSQFLNALPLTCTQPHFSVHEEQNSSLTHFIGEKKIVVSTRHVEYNSREVYKTNQPGKAPKH